MDCKDSISKCLEGIDAYLFKYKPEAQKKYEETGLLDDKLHLGVMAQDLESNPLTASAVNEMDDGLKVIDTKQVALIDLALITDIARRLDRLEKKVGL